MEIGLSLGSNLGDRLNNLRQAREKISAMPGFSILASSPVYETEPVGVSPQFADMPFLNAILIVISDIAVEHLFEKCAAIEKVMGRNSGSGRNSPRPIDIDIIFAGDHRIKMADENEANLRRASDETHPGLRPPLPRSGFDINRLSFNEVPSLEGSAKRGVGLTENSLELAPFRIDGGVPHPRWAQRRFVVQPLADVRPDLHIPGESRTVREVLLALPPTPKVVLFTKAW